MEAVRWHAATAATCRGRRPGPEGSLLVQPGRRRQIPASCWIVQCPRGARVDAGSPEARYTPAACSGQDTFATRSVEEDPSSSQATCAQKLLQFVSAGPLRRSMHRRSTFSLIAAVSRRGGIAAEAATVMQDCPWALLDDFACEGCVAPPRGFRPANLLAKVRAVHAAYPSGRKVLPNPLSWAGEDLTCDEAATESRYAAAAQAPPSQGVAQRVACLYLAALPNDYPPLRRMAQSFARHCDWAKFFAAPSREEETRSSWKIRVGRRDFEVVNLAQAFRETQADKSWMKMQWTDADKPTPGIPRL